MINFALLKLRSIICIAINHMQKLWLILSLQNLAQTLLITYNYNIINKGFKAN